MYNRVDHAYTFKFPEGALRKVETLLAIMDEVAHGGEPATLYFVTQSGYMTEFPITAYTTIVETPMLFGTHVALKIINPDNKYQFLSDVGVGGNGETPVHDSHRTFTDKAAAEAYSNWMKTDPLYIASVKAWHDYCDESFRWIDDIFDYD